MDIESARIPGIPIAIGRVGLGTWAMGGFQWGGSDDDESVRTIHVALERDINLIRWVLDTPGVSVALWGPRHPSEVVPLEELMRFHLDEEARTYIDAVLAETIRDPIGPEFMAPPERPAEAAAQPASSI